MNFRLRTVRIVQSQDRSLGKSVARPQAARVVGIALDLRGPRHVAFHQHARGDAAQRYRRRVKQRLARE